MLGFESSLRALALPCCFSAIVDCSILVGKETAPIRSVCSPHTRVVGDATSLVQRPARVSASLCFGTAAQPTAIARLCFTLKVGLAGSLFSVPLGVGERTEALLER